MKKVKEGQFISRDEIDSINRALDAALKLNEEHNALKQAYAMLRMEMDKPVEPKLIISGSDTIN